MPRYTIESIEDLLDNVKTNMADRKEETILFLDRYSKS
jgi:hypothetical protein